MHPYRENPVMNQDKWRLNMLDFTSPKLWAGFALLVLSTILTGLVWVAYEASIHDGKPDYCYISMYGGEHPAALLYAHRPWASDKIITSIDLHDKHGSIEIVETLQVAADKIKCPLK